MSLVLHVVLNQLGQRGKLVAAEQVVKVAIVLDFDVCHFAVAPAKLIPTIKHHKLPLPLIMGQGR